MIKEVVMCDLCDRDGDIRKAVATYTDAGDCVWDVCAKHLEHVKEAKLKFLMLAKEE